MDDETGRRRSRRFQEVDKGNVTAEETGVEDEVMAQGKAQEKAQEKGESEGGDKSGELGRQDPHQAVRESQRDKTQEEKHDREAVEAGEASGRGSFRGSGPGETAEAAPEKPGAEEKAEREFVAVKFRGKFPEEIYLEGRGQEAEEEGREPGLQVQTPGMSVPHVSHRPALSRIASIRYPTLWTATFPHLGQNVLSPSWPGTLPT
jgi:hypothetical protein